MAPAPQRPDLDALIKRSKEIVAAMTPDEVQDMCRRQAEGVARAEATWPKTTFVAPGTLST